MDRWEQSAWPLAGGALCAFVLAVVLKDAAWQFAFAAVAVSVVGWALCAPVAAGGALGAVAWAVTTGFDVSKTGELAVPGLDDLARAGLLVGLGLAAGVAGKVLSSGRSGEDIGDISPAQSMSPFEGVHHISGVTDGPYRRPVPRQRETAARFRAVPVPGHSTKETNNDV
ncbi:hypothetical protein J4573_43190 [Actinomadura barringtoniae]|uniref:Uncharacterized protein n=1 Tax=Actinomadura barringtoniae TaxID=1427535 RepID=A0A939PJB9_9ACTN|nr:hypothetical protein [Actinomadura barringtoniae]MBO2453957.1 hypothetical protein [Actinomadura barringtoniae]